MEKVPLLDRDRGHRAGRVIDRVVHPEQTSEVAPSSSLFVDLGRDKPRLVPLGYVRLDGGLDPFPDFGTERRVRFVEVWRVILWVGLSVT